MIRDSRLRIVLGLAAAAVALWLALRRVDTVELLASLAAARPGWIAAAAASVVATVAAGVVRWRVLLGPVPGWRPLADGVLVGQMMNIVLPLRLGEIARTAIVSRATGLPAGRVLTTIAVEKLGDVAAAGLAAVLLLAVSALPESFRAGGGLLTLAGALAAAAILIAAQPPAKVRALTQRAIRKARGIAPESWRARIEGQFATAAEGLSTIQNRRRSAGFWMLSVGVLLLAASTNYLLLFAFDLRVPAAAALALLVALQVGTTLVSVPGNLGVFHYIVFLVLTAYGVDPSTAVAYAFVLYAVAILPKIVGGALMIAFGYGWAVPSALPR